MNSVYTCTQPYTHSAGLLGVNMSLFSPSSRLSRPRLRCLCPLATRSEKYDEEDDEKKRCHALLTVLMPSGRQSGPPKSTRSITKIYVRHTSSRVSQLLCV